MAKKGLVPKSCVVHSIHLGKRTAEVRFRCSGETGGNEYRTTGRDGSVTVSNYPSKVIRGVTSIRLPGGITISGSGAAVHGFTHCSRERSEITCRPSGE